MASQAWNMKPYGDEGKKGGGGSWREMGAGCDEGTNRVGGWHAKGLRDSRGQAVSGVGRLCQNQAALQLNQWRDPRVGWQD